MSGIIGPNIVTDGLVLYLDAGNIKSYPTTGTTWYDLSGNRFNGILSGATYSGSSIVFNGVNIVTLDGIAAYSNLNNHTYSAWIKSNILSGYRWILNNGTNSQGTSLITNNNKIAFFYSGGASLKIANTSFATGQWVNIVTAYNKLGYVTFYLNGIYDGTGATGTWLAMNNNPRIGTWYNGSYQFSGNLSNIMIYNKELSSDEALQNYNAIKSRYNLT